jgi:hypothetical protein
VKVADLMTFSCRNAMIAQVGWRTRASEAILRQTIGFQTSMKITSLSRQSQIGARVLRYAGAGGERESLRKGLACTNFYLFRVTGKSSDKDVFGDGLKNSNSGF